MPAVPPTTHQVFVAVFSRYRASFCATVVFGDDPNKVIPDVDKVTPPVPVTATPPWYRSRTPPLRSTGS